MKHLLALATLLGLAGTASASLAFYEPFDYSSGANLAGQTPDGTHTWAATDTGAAGLVDMAVSSGSLSGASNMSASQGNKVTYGAGTYSDRINAGTFNSGSVYYSMLLNISDIGTLGTATAHNQILAGFNNSTGTQTGNPSAIGSTLWVGAGGGTSSSGGTDSSDYQLGISINSATTTRAYDLRNIALGDTLFVVGAFNYGADTTYANATGDLWIFDLTTGDAVPGAMPGSTVHIAGTGVSGSLTIASMLLYSTSSTIANHLGSNGVNVDELRVGTTWADVVPVPEPSTVAFAGLCGLFLAARRFRR